MSEQNFRVRNGLSVGNTEIQANTGDFNIAGNLTVAGETRLGNIDDLKIPGGGYGYYTITDGLGNLSFAPVTPAANAVQTFTFTGDVNENFGNSQVANIYLGSDFSVRGSALLGTATWTWSAGGQLSSGGGYNFDWTVTNISTGTASGSASASAGAAPDLVNAIFAALAASDPTVFSSGSAPTSNPINNGTLNLAAGVFFTAAPQLTITKTSGSALWNRNPSNQVADTWSSGGTLSPTYQFSIPSYPGYAGNANVWVALANGANAQTAVAEFYTAFSQASQYAGGVFTLANNPGGIANSFSINFNSNNSSFTMGLIQTNTGPGNAFVTNTPPGSSVNTINYSLTRSTDPVLFDTVTFTDPLTSQTSVTRLYPGNTLTQAVSRIAANTALAFTAYDVTGSLGDITFVRLIPGELVNTQFPQVTVTLAAGGNGTLSVSNAIISYGQGGAAGVSQIIAGTNITVDPPGGTGVVTINSTGGGGGGTAITGLWRSSLSRAGFASYTISTNTFTGSTTANSNPTSGATLAELGLSYLNNGSNWYFRNDSGGNLTLAVTVSSYVAGNGTKILWTTVGAANTVPTAGGNTWLSASGGTTSGEFWPSSSTTLMLQPWQTFAFWFFSNPSLTFGGSTDYQQSSVSITRLG